MAKSLLNLSQNEIEKYALKYYKMVHGKECNIEHPIYFTEKLQWYTFRYDNPLCPYIVDKVTFKDYIREKLGEGYTIPILGAWKNINDFKQDWDQLPEEFCLKSNLQSDGLCIKIIHHKSKVNIDILCKEVSEWLKPENTNRNSLARRFYERTPQILAEKYMSNYNDQLYDYKFFCFSGVPYCMYVATEHFGGGENRQNYPITFYDINWKKLDVRYGEHPNAEVPEPKHFCQMKELARILSKDFPFVRVDFFDTEDHLYLAELTFNPGAGFTPYYPESFNKKMGDLFVIPTINNYEAHNKGHK